MGQVDAEEITLIETVEEALAVQPPEDCELAFATQTTLSLMKQQKSLQSCNTAFLRSEGQRAKISAMPQQTVRTR